jgi:cephalosporin hydroxylase
MNEKVKRLIPRPAILKIKAMRDQLRFLKAGKAYRRGYSFAQTWNNTAAAARNGEATPTPVTGNPLWEYFERNVKGPGIFKWHHYFEIYHRHLAKFIGKPVKILEIGIFSGGSLGMWKSYFGPQCHVYGVDIEEACKAYESKDVSVFIGDQEDPAFWDRFIKEVGDVDIVIDDGGHTDRQQMVTLEKMLPHLRAGGVYICEDIHGIHHKFAEFASGLVSELNRTGAKEKHEVFSTSGFQSFCHSIHCYPFVTVIERTPVSRPAFFSIRRGTEWQPFYEKYNP